MMRVLYCLAALLIGLPASAEPRYLSFEAFGDVAVYGTSNSKAQLAIILADRTLSVQARDGLGQAIAAQGGLAAVVDVERYSAAMDRHPETCAYHSWEFEKLSKFIQKTLGLSRYDPPILLGLGAGAGLSYTTFNEAPRGTFAGMMVSGLCRPFRMKKDLCSNEDETWSRTDKAHIAQLEPVDKTSEAWVALPSSPMSSCDANATADFFAQIDGAEVLSPSQEPWGSAVWQSDIANGVTKVRSKVAGRDRVDADLADLPLHEELAKSVGVNVAPKTMAIILTGDGGWAGLDRELAENFAAAGVNVVGLNSLRFFWKKRTPDETAEALSRVMAHYTKLWNAQHVLLIGYSFGADVLPFAVRRLSDDDLKLVKGVALLAPGFKADFEFNVTDWLSEKDDPDALPVLPEILAMPTIPLMCAFASEEEEAGETSCPQVPASRAKPYKTSGGHHFDGDFKAMAKAILELQSSQPESGL